MENLIEVGGSHGQLFCTLDGKIEPDFRYDDQDTVPIPPHKFENCSEGFEGGQRVGTCTQKEGK